MSDFAADWLALRAAADVRARDSGLAAALRDRFAEAGAGMAPVRIVDLGAGSGNNLVATAPLLPPKQAWTLVDRDAELLALARERAPDGLAVETRVADLHREIGNVVTAETDLVTASAFFDLCGAAWLDRLADALEAAGAALYAVLSYDGRETWSPPHPLDDAVRAAFHADQSRDKGFGPSLGPGAHAHLVRALGRRGFTVREAPSDWTLERPRDAALIAELAAGSARAVADRIGAGDAASWCAARQGADRVVIGHRDLLALPPAR